MLITTPKITMEPSKDSLYGILLILSEGDWQLDELCEFITPPDPSIHFYSEVKMRKHAMTNLLHWGYVTYESTAIGTIVAITFSGLWFLHTLEDDRRKWKNRTALEA